MSHFSVHVLIPRLSDPIEEAMRAQVDRLLAPFSEGLSVAPYQKPCYCVGRVARGAARAAAEAKVGTIDELRERFKKEQPVMAAVDHYGQDEDAIEKASEAWQAFIAPFTLADKEAFEAHPLKTAANAACDSCGGDGSYESTSNPRGEWDWWCLGGRWTGGLVDHNPATDPDNLEACECCNGTGVRPGGRAQFGEEWFKQTNGCNGCNGKGKRLKFPAHLKNVGNILPLSEFLPRFDKKHCPFAVVTPDGEWHERGDMGFWGMVTDEKKRDVWVDQVRALYARFPDSVVVLVDCHV